MQITVEIAEVAPGNGSVVLASDEAGMIKVVAGTETRIVAGALLERAAQNALNVGPEPDPALFASTRVSEADSDRKLVVENHPSDRERIVVKLGQEMRDVVGRQIIAGVRHCMKSV